MCYQQRCQTLPPEASSPCWVISSTWVSLAETVLNTLLRGLIYVRTAFSFLLLLLNKEVKLLYNQVENPELEILPIVPIRIHFQQVLMPVRSH